MNQSDAFDLTPQSNARRHSQRQPHRQRRPHGDPLVSAKLSIPNEPPAHLARKRLYDTLSNARRLTAVTLLAAVPHGQAGASARLLQSTLALARFDTTAARGAVDAADKAVAPDLDERSLELHLGIRTVRVVLARLTGDADAAESAVADMDRLWGLLSPENLAAHAGTRALVLAGLGVAQFWAGRHAAARATLARAAGSIEPGTEYGAHDALGHLALLDVYEGRPNRAEKSARESLALAERIGVRPDRRVGAASAALAAITLLRNDLPAVREHLSRAIVTAGARHDPPTATAIALLRARVAAGRCDGRRALAAADGARAGLSRWCRSAAVDDRIEVATFAAHLMLGNTAAAGRCVDAICDPTERIVALATLHLMMDEPDHARQVLSTPRPRGTRPTILLDAHLILGRLAHADGDGPAAVDELRRALAHARPERLRRPFTEAVWARDMLRQHPELTAEHAWLAPRTSPADAAAGGAPPIEPLTEREAEVLHRLTLALSTEDIANAMYLSVNTVKTHLKSIYRKLGTSGRSAAAQRARELNLVPPGGPDR